MKCYRCRLSGVDRWATHSERDGDYVVMLCDDHKSDDSTPLDDGLADADATEDGGGDD